MSRKSLSIPGGRLMVILIPWKPVVVGWCILAAMLWVGYVGFSVLEGKNPFAAAQRPLRITFRYTALPITGLAPKAI